MKKMESECEELKERCHEQGFNVSVFDATAHDKLQLARSDGGGAS